MSLNDSIIEYIYILMHSRYNKLLNIPLRNDSYSIFSNKSLPYVTVSSFILLGLHLKITALT